MLQAIPVLDHHAHNLLSGDSLYSAAFTEGYHPTVERELAPHGLFYRRSLREAAEVLECRPEEVLERRQELSLEALTELFFARANMECVYLDDGLFPGRIHSLEWHRRFVPVKRLLRVELEAERLSGEESDFDVFEARLRARLAEPGPVGYKSIAAYRSGLNLAKPSRETLRRLYPTLRGQRLEHPDLVGMVVRTTLELAAANRLPVQFHTGFGDPDLALAGANPLWLQPVIEEYPDARFVLLHAGYPFTRETGFLASVYPNVWADFGLAVPFLSVAGMRRCLSELLELAPLNRVLYSSDASRIPELFYFGARWARRTLAKVLEETEDLTASEVEEAGRWILRENALRLYSPDRG